MPDKDKSDTESDPEPKEIDLDNLPQDPKKRLELLGIDPSILADGGREAQEFVAVMQMSAIEEIRKR